MMWVSCFQAGIWNTRPVSRITGSSVRTPCIVFISTSQIVEAAMAMTRVTSLAPNTMMNVGTRAAFGIERK